MAETKYCKHCGHFNSCPHGGRRCACSKRTAGCDQFQLTPSRRATAARVPKAPGQIHFNSRPHGGRRSGCPLRLLISISTHALTEGDNISRSNAGCVGISTHALTEGDCKFRQIFLLNRGYAYSISLYFLPHFISLLPQILSFQQKPFKFQVRIFLLFSVHLAFALQNLCFCTFHPNSKIANYQSLYL